MDIRTRPETLERRSRMSLDALSVSLEGAYQPRHDKPRRGIDSHPGPQVPGVVRLSDHSRRVLISGVAEGPHLITLDRLRGEAPHDRSWNRSQASPKSTRSFMTVMMDTPTTREVDRIEDPSQSI